ncbi:PspA/IM30 family protein [Desulfoscipio geothermicus]|uniref:Phage shock protein A (PspA) family protein n=1 Tax=Desulfoscipio geothermicus DSM 3669 TaxID=1121426 RepID=A0A1I6DV67_9FIRM|nr:PspA/IM30 family protein [Desulfoscipio geothermicus]SFR09257.1 phage shock protein A (PspA) family protein [Desulfoscipio geothermicus DSM 3669]
MGVLSRVSSLVNTKINKLLDRVEKPEEILEYSYQKQLEQLRKVRRGLADIGASKKMLEFQLIKLKEKMLELEKQAKKALSMGRDDLAAIALERKMEIQKQVEQLNDQISELEKEQEKLATAKVQLSVKVESFRTQKEVIKAQYSAAEAQVKISEAVSGISEDADDLGLALERAKDKTKSLRARAAAIGQLTDLGILEDHLDNTHINSELDEISKKQSVQEELKRLKKELQN